MAGRPVQYVLSAERQRLLREHYHGTTPALDCARLKQFAGVPGWVIRRWAKALGLASRDRRWTEESEALVEDHWLSWPLEKLAQLSGRSLRAVEDRARALNLEHATYSARDVAFNLSIHHSTVLRWEAEHMLKASTGRKHEYTREDLGNFFFLHRMEALRAMGHAVDRWLFVTECMAAVRKPRERRAPTAKQRKAS